MSTRTPVKSLLIGITLAFLTNSILLTTSYIVGKIQLKATEICIAKGIIQSTIYGIICFTQYLNVKRKGRPLENNEDQVKSPMKIFDVWAFLFCLFVAIMTIAAYLGLKLMPVPDFVVFGHTSPVYTVLFSACILRERLTPLKMILILFVITGVILIVQPTFIFSGTFNSIIENSTSIVTPTKSMHEYPMSLYYTGVVLALFASISTGMINVSAKKSMKVPRQLLMFGSGISTLILALIMHLCLLGTDFSEIPDIQIWKRYVLTTVVAVGSMIAGYLMLAANQNAPPVVISVARASEILLALVVDKILFGEEDTKGEFHNYNTKLILHTVGAILVLISVSLMAASEYIQEKMDQTCCNKTPPKRNITEEEVIEKENLKPTTF